MKAGDQQRPAFPNVMSRGRRAADFLGRERNVVVVSTVVFLLGFGEELRKRYLPKYLEALGGLLWNVEPQAPFVVAGLNGIVGTIVFAATIEERYAS